MPKFCAIFVNELGVCAYGGSITDISKKAQASPYYGETVDGRFVRKDGGSCYQTIDLEV